MQVHNEGILFKAECSIEFSFHSFRLGLAGRGKVDKHTNTGLFRLKSSGLTPKFGRDGSTWRKRAEHLAAANVHQKLAFFCSSMETCSPSEYERHHLKPHTRARAHTHMRVFTISIFFLGNTRKRGPNTDFQVKCHASDILRTAGTCWSAGMLQVGLNPASKLPVALGAAGKRAFTC